MNSYKNNDLINENVQGDNEPLAKRYPKKIIASFQLGNFIGLMMSQLYAQQLPYYYQTVIGLDITLYVIAMIIYMGFNMVNDPLLGFLCDKSKRLTSKWGKRFPFIIIGGVPWCFVVIFLFMAPSISQVGHIGVFFWLLFFMCLYDAVFSLYDINRVALFPDKFRDTRDRRLGGAITTVLETMGILLGILIPVLIISMYGRAGWTMQALIIAGLGFGIFLFMIPGVREGPEIRERRARLNEEETIPFFTGMKITLKDKNFIAYMALYVCYTSAMGLVMASMPFFVEDILQMSKMGEIILIFYVIAVIAAAPVWYKLSFKFGIKKVALIGAIMLGLMGIPLLFVPVGPEGLTMMIIILIVAGAVDGAIIGMTMPLFSSVVDDASVTTGRRQEGLYNGTFLFFSRIGIAYTAIVFWIVRTFTGYRSGSTSPSELMGLRIQMALFPLLIAFVGAIIFWKFYNLTSEQIEANAKKLIELDL